MKDKKEQIDLTGCFLNGILLANTNAIIFDPEVRMMIEEEIRNQKRCSAKRFPKVHGKNRAERNGPCRSVLSTVFPIMADDEQRVWEAKIVEYARSIPKPNFAVLVISATLFGWQTPKQIRDRLITILGAANLPTEYITPGKVATKLQTIHAKPSLLRMFSAYRGKKHKPQYWAHPELAMTCLPKTLNTMGLSEKRCKSTVSQINSKSSVLEQWFRRMYPKGDNPNSKSTAVKQQPILHNAPLGDCVERTVHGTTNADEKNNICRAFAIALRDEIKEFLRNPDERCAVKIKWTLTRF